MPENTSTIDGRDELMNVRYFACMYACDRFACGVQVDREDLQPKPANGMTTEQRGDRRLADAALQVDDGYAQGAFVHVGSQQDDIRTIFSSGLHR